MTTPGARACWQARALLESGRGGEALRTITELLAADATDVDAQRVRQDILRSRGRLGLLLAEAEQRVANAPQQATTLYLNGRIARGDAAKLALFERAVRVEPRSFWTWLGIAYALRQTAPPQAAAVYERLYRASHGHPLAAIGFASTLRAVDRPQEALVVYDRLRRHPLAPGIGEVGMAETHFGLDQLDAAWSPLLRALQLRPFDASARNLLGELLARGLPGDRLEQVIDLLAVPERARVFAAGGGGSLLAALLLAAGRPVAARAAFEGFTGEPPRNVHARRAWERLLLRLGDVRGFLEALACDCPPALLAAEQNRVRGVWQRILQGPWMQAKDPLDDPSAAAELTEALLRAGLLEEAAAVGEVAVLRHRDAAADVRRLDALRAEAQGELEFEHAMRRLLYRGYAATGTARSLDEILDDLRQISVEILGRDVVGTPARFSVPFVGEILDPFAEGLCGHFAAYNRHLVLGKRSGQPVEGLVLVRWSVQELADDPTLRIPGIAYEVIGGDRRIRSLSGVYGGDLAGVALLNHYLVDLDSVREWSAEIRDRRRIVAEDGGVAVTDPLPKDAADLEPADVHWRLEFLSSVPDPALDEAVLAMIRLHERAHLVDVSHFLPVELNLWRALGLLFRHGFSRSSIEAELEARAETAALAYSPHPELVLAHLAVFLDAPPSAGPHAEGFRRVGQRLASGLRAKGIDGRASRWHTADSAEVRRIAAELVDQQW